MYVCIEHEDVQRFHGTVAGLQNMHADTHTRFGVFFGMCVRTVVTPGLLFTP